MSAPTIYWHDGTSEYQSGTRTYTNVESGTAATFSGDYTIYNKGSAAATNCSFYVADVQGSHVSDNNVIYSIGTVAATTMSTDTTFSIGDLATGGTTNASQLDMTETIIVEVDDTVGTKEWSKNITYQYS